MERLKERLFDILKELSPGSYEFEGKYGIKISFDLVDSDSSFDRCYAIYCDVDCVEGSYHPIYSITNLKIQTKNFSYNIKDHSRSTTLTWLPNLRSTESELSHSFVNVGPRHIYLIDEDGLFSRPIDLLGYFHELGHVETRSPDQLNAEYRTVKTTISSKGVKTEPVKKAAYRLQQEYDANEWMLSNTCRLFEDLDISSELTEYYVYLQQKSYHDSNRKRFFNPDSVLRA